VDLASKIGLHSLTIGGLARELDLSKSGLFEHFGSKERLQQDVVQAAADMFVAKVVDPAIREPKGEPRLRALFDRWLRWADCGCKGGCVLVGASFELDDRPGPVREVLVTAQRQWLDTLAAVIEAGIEESHFRDDLDSMQFAFDAYSLMLGYHHAARLLHDPNAKARVKTGLDRLIACAKGNLPLTD